MRLRWNSKHHKWEEGVMRSDNRRRTFASALAVLLGVAFGAEAYAQQITMKMGVTSAEDAETNYLRFMKEAIEPASNGRIKADIYTRGQLGSQSASIQGLQLGTIEAFITPADFYSG